MALTVSGLKIAAVGLTQRACRPTLLQAAKYSWEPKEVETHTGQKWEKDDYRLARFIDREKEVNKSFAIDLIEQVPPKPCTERVVYCDGGGGPLGHPKVYINLKKVPFCMYRMIVGTSNVLHITASIWHCGEVCAADGLYLFLGETSIAYSDKPGNHACGYCGLRFVKKDSH